MLKMYGKIPNYQMLNSNFIGSFFTYFTVFLPPVVILYFRSIFRKKVKNFKKVIILILTNTLILRKISDSRFDFNVLAKEHSRNLLLLEVAHVLN